MSIETITPLRFIPALTDPSNMFLKMLAHYKPNIAETIESDIWAKARVHTDKMSILPLVTQEVILSQLTDAIIESTVAKYDAFYKEHRNEKEYDLRLSIGEAIEWWVDPHTMLMAIIGEQVFSIADIEKAIDGIIKAETTAPA